MMEHAGWNVVAWWATLGVGAVVLLVVGALLELLRRSVQDLRDQSSRVLRAGGWVAQCTWSLQMLRSTSTHAKALHDATRGGDPDGGSSTG